MRRTLNKVLKILDGQPTGKRGQSFVEMAFATPFLVVMVMGLVEVGYAANNFLVLMDAVREAGRQAVNMDPTGWQYNEARNQEKMDCDATQLYWNFRGTQGFEGSVNGDRHDSDGTLPPQDRVPRGSALNTGVFSRNPYFNSTNPDTQSFFDIVACQALISMSPLILNDDDATSKDDVVVSAISYANMDYTGLAAGDQGSSYAAGPGSHGNHWVTVTGRWPIENRYCRNGVAATGADVDARDPFDFKRFDINKNATTGYHNGLQLGTDPDDVPASRLFERVFDTPPNQNNAPDTSDFDLLETDNTANVLTGVVNQGVRGFMLMGHHVTTPNGCYGSDFTVQDIETRLNLDSTNNVYVPNGGLVIVEIFWQYHPLVFGPLFEGFNSKDKTADPVFHVWGFFPVPSVESTATP